MKNKSTKKTKLRQLTDRLLRRFFPNSWASVSVGDGKCIKLKRKYADTFNAFYEPNIAREIRRIKPNTFWDIGAFIGYWSFFTAAHGAREVLSFEPNLCNFNELIQGIGCNDLWDKISPRICAISNQTGIKEFYGDGVSSTSGLSNPFAVKGRRDVACQILDQQNGRPDLIKVDVEGWEGFVIQGAHEILMKNIPLIIEVHPFQMSKVGHRDESLLESLEDYGYEINVIHKNKNGIYTVLAQ